MTALGCVGNPWTMILAYEADLKHLEFGIDPNLSDWDGKKNAVDKFPLDPAKH